MSDGPRGKLNGRSDSSRGGHGIEITDEVHTIYPCYVKYGVDRLYSVARGRGRGVGVVPSEGGSEMVLKAPRRDLGE